MNRKDAREAAFRVLFSRDFNSELTPLQLWQNAVEEGNVAEDDAYATGLMRLLTEHEEEVDSVIVQYAVGWKMSRISHVSRSVLRLAITEMLYMPDIPLLVSLNEGIELSKKYDDEKAYGFINGVLHAVSLDARATEARTTEKK